MSTSGRCPRAIASGAPIIFRSGAPDRGGYRQAGEAYNASSCMSIIQHYAAVKPARSLCREGEEIPSIHRRPRQPNVREGHAFRGRVWGTKAKPLAQGRRRLCCFWPRPELKARLRVRRWGPLSFKSFYAPRHALSMEHQDTAAKGLRVILRNAA